MATRVVMEALSPTMEEGRLVAWKKREGEPVKILGSGEITVALQVSVDAFSASAREKITAAGGTATEV